MKKISPEDIKYVTEKLDKFVMNGKVPIHIAQRLIKDSAYWYDHPCGHPVHAPSHFERITGGLHGWSIEFGANTFHIEKALRKCILKVHEALTELEHEKLEKKELHHSLSNIISEQVSNFQGDFMPDYWIDEKGFMKFGSQAINVDDFINTIFNYIKIDKISR